MHRELKAVINDVITQIKSNAVEMGYELSPEQSEQVLAQAISTHFEVDDSDLRSIVLDVLDEKPEEISIENISLALLGIDAMIGIIQQSKPYQQMLASEHYYNYGDASVFQILKEIGKLRSSIRDFQTEISLDKKSN